MKKQYYYDNRYKHICILGTSLNEFMKHNPPCKTCLIQTMCLTEYEYDVPNEIKVYHEITIILCEKMIEFINNDIKFNDEFGELRDWKGINNGKNKI